MMVGRKMFVVKLAVLVLCLAAATAWSGERSRILDGSCSTLEKTPFTYTGDVVTVGILGEGLEIALAEGNVTFFGLGPDWYWETLGVDKPVVGETVTVEGFTVSYNGVDRNILTAVVIEGEMVPLRGDDDRPLWRNPGSGMGFQE